MKNESASLVQMLGAGGFGVLLGWLTYYTNRYRTGDVRFSDLVSVVGVVGGGGILALFDPGTDMFGAYGIGLIVGFFGYLAVLAVFVSRSSNFTVDWFLDGRRTPPPDPSHNPNGTRRQVAMGESNGREAPIGK